MTEHTIIRTELDDDEAALLADDIQDAAPEPDEPDSPDVDTGEELVADDVTEASPGTPDEVIARRFGWKPKAEWKGDTTNHMEAGDYLEKVIKPRLEMVPKVQELEGQLAEVRREAMRLALRQQEADKQQDTTTLEQLRAAQKRAFDLGDDKAFNETQAKLDEYYQRRQPAPREDQVKLQERQQAANADPAFLEWLPQNQDWYGSNEAATHLAAQIAAERLRAENVTDVMSLPVFARRAFYAEIASEVRKRMDITPAARQSTPKPPASEDGATSRKAAPVATKKGWNNLPQDARQAYLKLSRSGIYPADEKGKQEYARDYFKHNPA